MTAAWAEGEFQRALTDAVERLDREGATRRCNELVAALDQGAQPSLAAAKAILQTLRRKCYFDLMERVAEALRLAGLDGSPIRRQHAQSLIDQGKVTAAIDVLDALVARTADDPGEHAEARGLLGRAYKQLYVNAASADPEARTRRTTRLHLQRAVSAYHDVYRSAPTVHLWHGVNTVALVLRARRDGVPLDAPPDAEATARAILGVIEARRRQGPVDPWDLATAAEASLALGDAAGALALVGEYVQQPGADAFELASFERQLREVWGLTVSQPPGLLLLPVLQAQLLQRRGGQVHLAPGTLGATVQATGAQAADGRLERILGREGVVSLQWYRQGLERCRAVAQVRTPTGEGFGTGFLVRGQDLGPALDDALLLLTNAHVVSPDPAVQARYGALPPEDAGIAFEALDAQGPREVRVAQALWTSPPEELDATLLRLDPPVAVADLAAYPVAPALPVKDGQQKVYVIGHPGGRSLSLSLHDNVLLDYDDRRIHYRAPTEGGSSGSPVFNQQWKLIGLHHAGSLEMARLNDQGGTYPANEGIWIRRIAEAVRQAGIA